MNGGVSFYFSSTNLWFTFLLPSPRFTRAKDYNYIPGEWNYTTNCQIRRLVRTCEKNANANAKANAKGIIYRYKRKYKHSEVCTRIYHNAAHKVDFLAFKLPHRRVKCGGKLPLPVFVFYARKSREIKSAWRQGNRKTVRIGVLLEK